MCSWEKVSTVSYSSAILILPLFFFFGGGVILGLHSQHIEVPRLGIDQSCGCGIGQQPQQHQIQAVFATYTTAHRNVGSLMH